MKTPFRIIIIGIGALVLGVGFNQLHKNGIPWKILQLSFPLKRSQMSFHAVSTDSAFSFIFDQAYQFIDIREKELFDIDHIPHAVSFPFQKIFRDQSPLPDSLKMRPVIIYDRYRHSTNAELTARYFSHAGFENVIIMHGGFIEWLDRGYPIEQGKE